MAERTLELRRVEIHQINNIDAPTQTFHARYYIVLAFPGGARDPELSVDSSEFPKDPVTGKPTFKPPARWYLDQIEMYNATHSENEFLSKSARPVGDDIELSFRVEGTIKQRMDLRAYPFDCHMLTAQMVLYCRLGGPLAVKLVLPAQKDRCVLSIHHGGFFLEHRWWLDREVSIAVEELDFGGRKFPIMSMSFTVQRNPSFVLRSVAFPHLVMGLIACVVQYALPFADSNDRINAMLTLYLTFVSAKLMSKSMMPVLSYSTLLDKFIDNMELVVLISMLTAGVLCFLVRNELHLDANDNFYSGMSNPVIAFEVSAISVLLVLWGLFCTRFLVKARRELSWGNTFADHKFSETSDPHKIMELPATSVDAAVSSESSDVITRTTSLKILQPDDRKDAMLNELMPMGASAARLPGMPAARNRVEVAP